MPAQYKYGFLPKSREKALEAASTEFYECGKQCRKLDQEIKALNDRLDFLGALLVFGTQGIMPDGELRKRVETVIGQEGP
ncbi:hypothetical protein SBV1_150020 [Verrucomicrobia bacterium]|nr:hypothetical protein SBV1_150020 [Verrucomicrobiota bacterium]